MNRLILLFLSAITLSALECFGYQSMSLSDYQNVDNKVRLDSVYNYPANSDVPDVTYYRYNDKGQLINVSTELYPPVPENLYVANYDYSYNELGQLVGIVRSMVNTNEILYDFKTEGAYDSKGRLSSQRSYKYSNGDWIPNDYYDDCFEREYDDRDRVIKNVTLKWSSTDNCWFEARVSYSNYDDCGRKILSESNWRNVPDGPWVDGYKSEAAFDENGNQTLNVYYDWIDGAWVGRYKYEYAYDDEGAKLKEEAYKWSYESSQWVNNTLYLIEYGYSTGKYNYGSKFYKVQTNSTWSEEKNEYIPMYKYVCDYINDNDIEATAMTWDAQSQSLVISGKYLYSYEYDTNNRCTSQTFKQWDFVSESWRLVDVNSYKYDSNGNKISSQYDAWDNYKQCLVFYVREETEYDADGNVILKNIFEATDQNPKGEYLHVSTEYKYDQRSNLTYECEKYSNPDSDTLINYSQDIYQYDEKDRMVLEEKYRWYGSENRWVCESKTEREYNKWDLLAFEKFSYEWGSTWTVEEMKYMFYSEPGSNKLVDNFIRHNYKVYDNQVIFDESCNVVVSDINGRISFSGFADTVNLQPGVNIIKTPTETIKLFIK